MKKNIIVSLKTLLFSYQFQIWFQLYKLFKLKELLVMIYEYPFLDINKANPMMLSIPKYR